MGGGGGVLGVADAVLFTVSVVGADNAPASDPDASVTFVRQSSGTTLSVEPRVTFPRTFRMPQLHEGIRCDIRLSRYRPISSSFFIPSSMTPSARAVALRDPSRWSPSFIQLKSLDMERFARFAAVASSSDGVQTKNGQKVGRLENAYDTVPGDGWQMGRMCLLNLYAVLTDKLDPVQQRPWFAGVNKILVVDRERLVAEIDDELYHTVRTIANRLDDFRPQGFFTEPDPGLHLANFPAQHGLQKDDLITIKNAFEQGNTQLTVARSRTAPGNVYLLDADMDEHRKLLPHTSDLFKHYFNGGTHPIDMHEYIVAHAAQKSPGGVATIDLGYSLSPRA